MTRLLPVVVFAVTTAMGCAQNGREAGRQATGTTAMPGNATAAPPQVVEVPIGPVPGGQPMDRDAVENPFAEDREALADGRRFFVAYNCAGCHGDHGGGGMGPSLRDTAWIYGGSHAEIANSIARGRAHGMPAWASRLTPTQVWQITAYLKSLRTPREPQPPPGS